MNTMDILNIINALVLIVGLPALLKAALYVGKKLQTLETLEVQVKSLDTTINGLVLPELRVIKEQMVALDTKVNIMWEWFSRHIVFDPQSK